MRRAHLLFRSLPYPRAWVTWKGLAKQGSYNNVCKCGILFQSRCTAAGITDVIQDNGVAQWPTLVVVLYPCPPAMLWKVYAM